MKLSTLIVYLYNRIKILKNKVLWNIFNSNNSLKVKHMNWLLERNLNKSEDFVPLTDKDLTNKEKNTKIITFYLPQFYENEVNDKNFGKGFMEWYNVTKAIPQYTGHNQPQLPIDVGFYNLTHNDVMFRQIELAKKYGIYGFCFYYYWFSGDRLLEKPLDNFLKNPDLDMPFCLFWANETWTHLWDNGNHRDIIKKQELLDGDDDRFINDILPYFNDKRYIKINNKPLLIIYKTTIFEAERLKKFIANMRSKIKEHGFDDVYLMITDNSGKNNIRNFDFDAVVEFSNTEIFGSGKNLDLKNRFVNPNFKGEIIDVKKALKDNLHLKHNVLNTFKTVCAGWDNTARKAYSGAQVLDMSPKDFKKWLEDDIKWTKENHSKDEQIVFIDSWNEWAEGAHLEPDQRYGYAYLQSVMDVVEEERI